MSSPLTPHAQRAGGLIMVETPNRKTPVKEERKERDKALESALSQIEKQYGKGAIMRMGLSGALLPIATIPTGSLELDFALGVGGIPRGRVVEIYGPESTGKTTLALHIVAEAQKRAVSAAFIDAEHALDANYAKTLGVNIDDLLISQPDTGEQASGDHGSARAKRRASTSSSSTPWRRWCRGRRSTARWVTRCRACRRV